MAEREIEVFMLKLELEIHQERLKILKEIQRVQKELDGREELVVIPRGRPAALPREPPCRELAVHPMIHPSALAVNVYSRPTAALRKPPRRKERNRGSAGVISRARFDVRCEPKNSERVGSIDDPGILWRTMLSAVHPMIEPLGIVTGRKV